MHIEILTIKIKNEHQLSSGHLARRAVSEIVKFGDIDIKLAKLCAGELAKSYTVPIELADSVVTVDKKNIYLRHYVTITAEDYRSLSSELHSFCKELSKGVGKASELIKVISKSNYAGRVNVEVRATTSEPVEGIEDVKYVESEFARGCFEVFRGSQKNIDKEFSVEVGDSASICCDIPPTTQLSCKSEDDGVIDALITHIDFVKKLFTFRVERIIKDVDLSVREIYFSKDDVEELSMAASHGEYVQLKYNVSYVSSLGKVYVRSAVLTNIEIVQPVQVGMRF